MSEILNFNDALNSLEIFKELCVAKIWIPSLQREITVKELSAKQQKTLLSAAVETASEYKSFFLKNLYQILLQNCKESPAVINNLNLVDYASIVIGLRKQTGEEVSVTFNTENKTEHQERINLNPVLERLKNINFPKLEPITFRKNELDIVIMPRIPTILEDVTFFDYLPTVKKQETPTDIFKQLIAETYMYESAKCIEHVSVTGKDLGYENLNVKQKYALVERLPAVLIQDLLNQITIWKNLVNEALTVESSNGVKKQLDLDSILFLTS